MEVTFRQEDEGKLVSVVRVADRDSVAGQVSLDNTGSAATGKYRLGVAAQHHNLFNRDIVGTLQMQTSPGFWKEVQVVSANARMPLYGSGWMIDASLVRSSVDSGTLQSAGGPTLFINSQGLNAGLKFTQLLPRWRGGDQKLSVGWDYKHVDSRVATTPGGTSLIPDIVLRPVTLAYNGLWKEDSWTLFSLLSHSRNIPGSGRAARSVFAEPAVRTLSNPDYRINRLNVSAAWPVLGGQASAAFSGQWSPDALVSAEQFGLGGDGSIRGFNGRVASNDEGERLGFEWQSAMRPLGAAGTAAPAGSGGSPGPASTRASNIAWGWQAYLEAGQLRRNLPQAGEVAKTRLAGIGLGVRLLFADQLSVRADLGVVLRGEGFAARGERFAHMAVNYGF
jgi:hemolysin activation/secretion protein